MAEYSTFGLSVKTKLLGPPARTLAWLCNQVREDTGMYVDSARMSRIITGADNSPRIMESITRVLNLDDDATATSSKT